MAGMNMQQMMKQARKMQEQLAAAQENLKSQTVDASAGGRHGQGDRSTARWNSITSPSIPMRSIPRTSICCRT